MKSLLPLVCFLLFAFPLLSQGQTIRYVKPGGTQSASTATSWATSTSDLQGAINASVSGDQVWVAAGTYKPTTGSDRTISFSLVSGVAIYGGFTGTEMALSQRPVSGQPSSTTLSGDIGIAGDKSDNSYHVIANRSSLSNTTRLDGFVISQGSANDRSIPNTNGVGGSNTGGGHFFQ